MSPHSSENAGRRVVAQAFVTLDGYMVGPDEDISWVIVNFEAGDELKPSARSSAPEYRGRISSS